MNLDIQKRYEEYITEIAITIADDIETDIDYYTEKEKEEFMEPLNKEDYYNLQQWIESYTNDIEREVMIILAHRLGFKYF